MKEENDGLYFVCVCVCVCVCMIQEDERKKREKEERMAREEEFLRSSLRGSRKLQALEKSPPTTLRPSVTGVVNIAYSTGEEEVEDTAAGGPVAAEDRTLGRLEDPGHKESALSSAGLALALARSNYLINAGSMQKVVGNSFIFSIIFLHLLYFLLHRVGFCLGIGLGFVSGIGLD